MLHLKIITPAKIVYEQEVASITLPTAAGEITVLSHHEKLLSLLTEGIITVRKSLEPKLEEYLAIGGGYLETDGTTATIIVSRAYHQDEIDEKLTEDAITHAEKIVQEAKEEKVVLEAQQLLRSSILNLKLLKKRHHRVHTEI
ncbi:ATP synthase F1 subunit epsilon [Candidatus Roizmanbacteria bacterium]|nr:ATP synthase F1 subunit epsilon [Candidatus Roizmanbacteria bacterium]